MHVGSLVIEHQDIDNSGEENMHELLYGIDAGAGNLLDADLLSTTTKEVYLQMLNGILLFVALNAICKLVPCISQNYEYVPCSIVSYYLLHKRCCA